MVGTCDYWKFQVQHFLKDPKFQVCVFDNRGCGKSTPYKNFYTTSDLAQDSITLIKHLGWKESINLVGVSLGGMIVQKMCLLSGEEPSRRNNSVSSGSGLTQNDNMVTSAGSTVSLPEKLSQYQKKHTEKTYLGCSSGIKILTKSRSLPNLLNYSFEHEHDEKDPLTFASVTLVDTFQSSVGILPTKKEIAFVLSSLSYISGNTEPLFQVVFPSAWLLQEFDFNKYFGVSKESLGLNHTFSNLVGMTAFYNAINKRDSSIKKRYIKRVERHIFNIMATDNLDLHLKNQKLPDLVLRNMESEKEFKFKSRKINLLSSNPRDDFFESCKYISLSRPRGIISSDLKSRSNCQNSQYLENKRRKFVQTNRPVLPFFNRNYRKSRGKPVESLNLLSKSSKSSLKDLPASQNKSNSAEKLGIPLKANQKPIEPIKRPKIKGPFYIYNYISYLLSNNDSKTLKPGESPNATGSETKGKRNGSNGDGSSGNSYENIKENIENTYKHDSTVPENQAVANLDSHSEREQVKDNVTAGIELKLPTNYCPKLKSIAKPQSSPSLRPTSRKKPTITRKASQSTIKSNKVTKIKTSSKSSLKKSMTISTTINSKNNPKYCDYKDGKADDKTLVKSHTESLMVKTNDNHISSSPGSTYNNNINTDDIKFDPRKMSFKDYIDKENERSNKDKSSEATFTKKINKRGFFKLFAGHFTELQQFTAALGHNLSSKEIQNFRHRHPNTRFLVLGGSKDFVIRKSNFHTLAKNLNSPIMLLESAGHMGLLDTPYSFNAALESFICDHDWLKNISFNSKGYLRVVKGKASELASSSSQQYNDTSEINLADSNASTKSSQQSQKLKVSLQNDLKNYKILRPSLNKMYASDKNLPSNNQRNQSFAESHFITPAYTLNSKLKHDAENLASLERQRYYKNNSNRGSIIRANTTQLEDVGSKADTNSPELAMESSSRNDTMFTVGSTENLPKKNVSTNKLNKLFGFVKDKLSPFTPGSFKRSHTTSSDSTVYSLPKEVIVSTEPDSILSPKKDNKEASSGTDMEQTLEESVDNPETVQKPETHEYDLNTEQNEKAQLEPLSRKVTGLGNKVKHDRSSAQFLESVQEPYLLETAQYNDQSTNVLSNRDLQAINSKPTHDEARRLSVNKLETSEQVKICISRARTLEPIDPSRSSSRRFSFFGTFWQPDKDPDSSKTPTLGSGATKFQGRSLTITKTIYTNIINTFSPTPTTSFDKSKSKNKGYKIKNICAEDLNLVLDSPILLRKYEEYNFENRSQSLKSYSNKERNVSWAEVSANLL